jgi:cytochrome c oxidase assembly protein subunit 15
MLKNEIGIFHACLAQAFFGLLVFVAIVTSKSWETLANVMVDPGRFATTKMVALLTTFAIYGQLGLGATMRHQHRDLAILDFPTANRTWLPDTSAKALSAINAWRDARGLSDVTAFQIWLQMAHRFGALIVGAGVVAFWVLARKHARAVPALMRLSNMWLGVLIFQISLGAWTIWSNKAADVATAHVAFGAVMFALGVAIYAICSRVSLPQADERSSIRSAQTREALTS